MSKFIVVHSIAFGAVRINTDQIAYYKAQSTQFKQRSYMGVGDDWFDLTETPEEIDKLIADCDRDYFAAKALAAMISNQDQWILIGNLADTTHEKIVDIAAASAYEYVDAMLARRSK